MPKIFYSWLQIGVFLTGYFYATSNIALAQVIPDNTLNTQVNSEGNIAEITGGETRGDNLFHSFQDFSVPNNNEAFFNNANNISNIFSRVTGGNISNIDGAIRTNDSASLYLINPAGIIFGENARLDVGGSFLASTADGILFPEGEFSAVNLDNPVVLTINAPIGLNLRNNSSIINRSRFREPLTIPDFDPDAPITDGEIPLFAANESNPNLNEGIPVGLKVNEGESITFNGGNIVVDRGLATAPGGRITLEATGDIELRGEPYLSFVERTTLLDTRSFERDGGIINLNSTAGNITISGYNLNSGSQFFTGSGGEVTIAGGEIYLKDSLVNTAANSASGRGGNVNLTGRSQIKLEDTRIDAANTGDGSSGDINLIALDRGEIELIGSQVERVDIFNDPDDIELSAEAVIFVDAFGGTTADSQTGGNLTIEGGNITIANYNLISRVNPFSEDLFLPNPNTRGDAGDIAIAGETINLDNSFLVTGTLGEGSAGDIQLIATDNITLQNTELSTRTNDSGSAGIVNLNGKTLTLDNSAIEASNIAGTVSTTSEVFAGRIDLKLTDNLMLRNDSLISAIANGNANGGAIAIETDSIIAFPANTTGSDIVASAEEGMGGTIDIVAESILGIQQNDSREEFSNDINASSNVAGLDGTISITTANVDLLKGTVELSSDTIDPNDIAARTCSTDDVLASTLAVSNTIRTPPSINRPFISENIYISGISALDSTTPEKKQADNAIALGNNRTISPAKGVVVQPDGKIALVAYPTPNTVSSGVYEYINCQ